MAAPVSQPCSREFMPAYHSSGTRSLAELYWFVVHDEEAPTAASAAHYFQSPQSGGSAQLCVDDSHCFRCLGDDVIPWGAASALGANSHGVHCELAGYAAWKPWQWLRHGSELDRAAYKAAQFCKTYNKPVRFVPASKLPNEHGITTHREISAASRRLDPAHAWVYSHSDPGPFWPRRWFMRRVRAHFAAL